MNRFILLFLSVVVVCYSCNETPSETNNASIPVTTSDSLYKAVIEGHDVGMARMGEIVRYKKLLQAKVDSLQTNKDLDTLVLNNLKTAIYDLNYAEELMNKWMQDFDPDAAGEKEVEKLAFYTKEKEKVDTVTVRIANSIDMAKTLVP